MCSAPRPSSSPRRSAVGPYLRAVRGLPAPHTPVWFMRQAGRSLPEYRRLREGTTMLGACLDPEMTCEVTLQPVRRYGVDAAILFSDIVVPLHAAGIGVDIVPGTGPVIAEPVRDTAAVQALPRLDAARVAPVTEAVTAILDQLDPQVALIGFAGAPFTLASYLIEGGPSRNHERTKALMLAEPTVFSELLERLAEMTVVFLRAQIDAGVDAVQLFDSWAGALSERDYRAHVAPHTARILADPVIASVPRTHFGVGTGELLTAMGEVGADVVGVDWRVPLDDAARRVPGRALQGNLDPAVLAAGPAALTAEVRRILGEAERARAAGMPGHVFNLGHGVLPTSPPDAIARVVETVHSETAR